MIQLKVDSFTKPNIYDVFVENNNVTHVLGQGLSREELNNKLVDAMKRFNINKDHMVIYSKYQEEDYLFYSMPISLKYMLQ